MLRRADWLRAMEEFADEGHRLAPQLAGVEDPGLREVAEFVRRAADAMAVARALVEFADRTLSGE